MDDYQERQERDEWAREADRTLQELLRDKLEVSRRRFVLSDDGRVTRAETPPEREAHEEER